MQNWVEFCKTVFAYGEKQGKPLSPVAPRSSLITTLLPLGVLAFAAADDASKHQRRGVKGKKGDALRRGKKGKRGGTPLL